MSHVKLVVILLVSHVCILLFFAADFHFMVCHIFCHSIMHFLPEHQQVFHCVCSWSGFRVGKRTYFSILTLFTNDCRTLEGII